MKTFSKGDRVRLSAKGLELYSTALDRRREQVGSVVGRSRNGNPRVRWDDNKVPLSYHPDFLERAEGVA